MNGSLTCGARCQSASVLTSSQGKHMDLIRSFVTLILAHGFFELSE